MFTIRSRRTRPAHLVLAAALAPILGACADHSTTGPNPSPATRAALAKELPTRGRILFHSRVTGDDELYSMQEDGSDIVRLTYSLGSDRDAVYSPDGRKIAFVSTRNNAGFNIYVMNADGTRVRRLTSTVDFGEIAGLTWSPDGKQIAFAATIEFASSQLDLYIMTSTGAQLKQLTNTTDVAEAHPAFSPTGDRIAFTSFTFSNGQSNIGSIAPDGSNPTVLIDCAVTRCQHPAWSPDGRYLAYSYFVTPTEIRKLRMDIGNGVPETVVTDAIRPQFSPDGLKLVYWKQDVTTFQVGTVTADGTSPAVLTNLVEGAFASSWGR